MRVASPGLLPFLLLLSACSAGDAGRSPTRTVARFLEAMDRSASDRTALQDAYELLAEPARSALQERAVKAETLSGRRYEPWDMLVQGRFRLRFAPRRRGGMRASVDGDSAQVTVRGEGDGDSALIPLVREEGRWRISMQIPAMRAPPPSVRPLSDEARVP